MSRIDLYLYAQAVGQRNSPIRSDDDGPSTFHTDTRSLKAAKKPRDFRGPGATETYFTSLTQAWQKGSIFRPEEAHECARTVGTQRGMRNDGQREQEEANVSKVVRPADPQKRARIMNTLKSRKALYADSRPVQFFVPYTPRVTSTNRARLFIPCLYHRFLSSPLRNHPFLSASSAFSILLFFRGSYGASVRLHCRDPINQCKIFALTGLTEGPRSHLWALKRVANIANKKQLTVAN